jgi:2-succinyl-6-hydroxy-2,4-cyclohexadiene-1-carboxylate synthase
MKLSVDDIQFNLLINENELHQNKTPIVFLHGFTGCANDWKFIFDKLPQNYLPIAIDLIGHGETDSPIDQSQYTCTAIVNHLHTIFSQLNLGKIIFVGYSMGGRAALSYSLKFPDEISAELLESTTAGIDNICDQKERVEVDLLLVEKIKNDGVDSFMDFWFSTPLFESLKKLPNYNEEKNKRSQNSVTGLSNILSGFSTGLMKSYWDLLTSLTFPVLLLSGSLDKKYTGINKEMNKKFPNSEHKVVSQCGHNVHLEKPELFTKFTLEFLNVL